MKPSRRASGEQGASLIIALGFLTLFGLLIPAILNLGATNLLGTTRLGEQREDTYTADGATDAAIQYLRQYPGCGRPFGSCPLGTGTVTYTVDLNGQSAAVEIKPLGATFDVDRQVQLTTRISGITRVEALVFVVDSSPDAELPVSVKSWRYRR